MFAKSRYPRGLVYIHVPKCGGSSFGAALRLRYFISQATITLDHGDPTLRGEARIMSDYRERDAQLRELLAAGIRLISGHVRYSETLHLGPGRQHAFVTLLRDPVERFVSHYNYLQRRHPNADRPDRLERFIETADAQRIASQYLFYFGGHSQTELTDINPVVRRAIRNLSRFDLIGDLARPAAFQRGLVQLTGTPLPHWRRNRAPQPTQVPATLLPQLQSICAPDIEIFRAALGAQEKAA